ncbi:MAG: FtsX-like permease family protein [Chlorobia bacterium]|nr:FtsX-like permease family protein [Fimbriimonadaceae bacterium]
MSQTEFKNVDPPFWVAWNQALASIRVRFLRHAITSLGIALGIAFFSSVLTMRLATGPDPSDPGSADRLLWLVCTSLVMCLVGVTNSMLMSVTERYREIGTIKCLGASDGFIVKVFFLESAILGAIGSFVGAFLGSVLMMLVAGANFSTVMLVTLLGTGTGIVMTILAAVAPAVQAAKMPAAAALRVDV